MTTPDPGRALEADHRLLETLQRILAIDELDLRGALSAACTQVAEVLGTDKADVFLYEAQGETLVALGTSDTEVGRRQRQIGMDRQPLANGGVVVGVFRSGQAYHTGRAHEDPEQLRGMVEGLGVRSEISVPLEVGGQRRGVLSVVSVQLDRFTEADLQFVRAVGGWMGVVAHRAELFEHAATDAVRRGRREAAEELARLTRRQQEIAVAVAEGLTNEEIAERLVLVPGTVANHVEAILVRLGLRNRTQLGVWAAEHGLYRSDQDQQDEQPGDREQWLGSSIGGRPQPGGTGDQAPGAESGPERDRSREGRRDGGSTGGGQAANMTPRERVGTRVPVLARRAPGSVAGTARGRKARLRWRS